MGRGKNLSAKNQHTTALFILFGIVTDITDQIEATDSLRSSEERYRQMFERNLAGVYKTHVDGTISGRQSILCQNTWI
jgi:PAS domain-containing protein